MRLPARGLLALPPRVHGRARGLHARGRQRVAGRLGGGALGSRARLRRRQLRQQRAARRGARELQLPAVRGDFRC
jgi:hypothetical protein